MPTYRPGRLTAVLVDKMDASTYLNASDFSTKLSLGEVTHYGSVSKEFIPGLADATINYSGLYDGTVLANYPSLDDLEVQLMNLATSHPVTMCFDGGIAVGRRCAIANAYNTNYTIGTPTGNVATMKVAETVTGRPSDGFIFTDGVAITTAVTTSYASVDNGVTPGATATGGFAALHIVANTWTGTTTVKIQHSVDNAVWVDLISQVVPATTTIAYAPTVAGTVNRYLRAQVITAAGSGSIKVVAAFART